MSSPLLKKSSIFCVLQTYLDIGKEEGAQVLTGGKAGTSVEGGYYIEPTIFQGHNKMRVFQEEIFGPVVSVTSFGSAEEAVEIANDTAFGLGAGVFTRDAHELVSARSRDRSTTVLVFFLILCVFNEHCFLRN